MTVTKFVSFILIHSSKILNLILFNILNLKLNSIFYIDDGPCSKGKG